MAGNINLIYNMASMMARDMDPNFQERRKNYWSFVQTMSLFGFAFLFAILGVPNFYIWHNGVLNFIVQWSSTFSAVYVEFTFVVLAMMFVHALYLRANQKLGKGNFTITPMAVPQRYILLCLAILIFFDGHPVMGVCAAISQIAALSILSTIVRLRLVQS